MSKSGHETPYGLTYETIIFTRCLYVQFIRHVEPLLEGMSKTSLSFIEFF